MRVVETDTAVSYQKIYQHQAVLILNEKVGQPWRGIILKPGRTQSFIRLNQAGIVKECRVDNKKIIPVNIAKKG